MELTNRPTALTKPVNPAMIILAREARGLTQVQLAEALGVTQGRVSKMEAGFLPVPDDLLEQLAQILHYPPHFFRREGSPMGVGIAEIYHRKRQDVPARVSEQIQAVLDIRRFEISALLRAAEIVSAVPHLDVDEYQGRVEDVAKLVRAGWRLPRGPIKDLTATLEDAGLIIVTCEFGTSHVDAVSRWVPGMPPLIYVNVRAPKDRLRFSLAHELGHLVMHDLPSPDMEEQAHRFAAEFLLPERDVRADLDDLTFAKLALLKRYWKVSMAALLMRAEAIESITRNQARYLWAQLAKAGYKTREPMELDVTGEQPSLLAELVAMHTKTLGFTESELAHMLALYEDELHLKYLPEEPRGRLHLVRA